MEFFLNPASLMPFFAVPYSIADKHLKLASELAIKVILYILRHSDEKIDTKALSEFFGTDEGEICDALNFWVNSGIISVKGAPEKTVNEPKPVKKTVRSKAVKPTREEIARRGNEDEKIAFLLREAQMKFGKALTTSEAATLVWLYDDAGVDVSLILMASEYASSSSGKLNIRDVEKIALDWADNGIKTITQAEERIALLSRQETSWRLLEAVFGLDRRSPSVKELEMAALFVDEWKFSREMLRAAYEQCVDSTGKFSMPYIKKILENWHKKGYATVVQTTSEKEESKPATHATYDLEAFMKKINGEE